jgi:hypothetical protein
MILLAAILTSIRTMRFVSNAQLAALHVQARIPAPHAQMPLYYQIKFASLAAKMEIIFRAVYANHAN